MADTELPLVVLARHGQTAWSLSGQHTGLTDLPLTLTGEGNARRLALRLQGRAFARVLCSPLQRARRTCELAGYGARAEIDARLLEWHYGDYEGLTSAEVHAQRPLWQLFRDGCPGGESPAQVAARADSLIATLRGGEGHVLLFSSGHFLRMLAARWLGLEPSGRCAAGHRHRQPQACWATNTRLQQPVIRLWNDTAMSTPEAEVVVPGGRGQHAARQRPHPGRHPHAPGAGLRRDSRDRYAQILQQLWDQLGYRDYLGALQRYRAEHPQHVELLAMSAWLLDYPFAERLYPGALQVLAHLKDARRRWSSCPTATWCSSRARCSAPAWPMRWMASVLIYIHKEQALADVMRRFPARHYVLIDDKPRILAAVKRQWQERVTTVLPRQGQYANDAAALAGGPAPDLQVEHIGELLSHDAHSLARRTPR
jgi:broad specificity phosphatase PhoE